MPPVRKNVPERTCQKSYASYRDYKLFLRQDFFKSCGYCGEDDSYLGGSRGFHIDHFRPHSKFPNLKAEYKNLSYSCPFCNIAKSDDWPGDDQNNIVDGMGYIDPCDTAYEKHLTRHKDGSIKPLSDIGEYMFNELHLGLKRKQYIWLLNELRNVISEVRDLLDSLNSEDPNKGILKNKYFELSGYFMDLEQIYRDSLT